MISYVSWNNEVQGWEKYRFVKRLGSLYSPIFVSLEKQKPCVLLGEKDGRYLCEQLQYKMEWILQKKKKPYRCNVKIIFYNYDCFILADVKHLRQEKFIMATQKQKNTHSSIYSRFQPTRIQNTWPSNSVISIKVLKFCLKLRRGLIGLLFSLCEFKYTNLYTTVNSNNNIVRCCDKQFAEQSFCKHKDQRSSNWLSHSPE